ncbi:MAG: hypothetical protein VX460_10400 [Planctomycetota bacterium]|nr:hypothetical protein [Planctomycetota bacterium]
MADLSAEISALAGALEERAALRTSLGAARVVIGDLEVLQPRAGSYRDAAALQREAEAVRAAVHHALEMALCSRLNVVDSRAGATVTHAIRGSILRDGDDVELALKFVDLSDGWIVAAAQRRIERLVVRDVVPVGAADEARGDTFAAAAGRGDVPASPPTVERAPASSEALVVPDDVVIEFEAGPAASRLGRRSGADEGR